MSSPGAPGAPVATGLGQDIVAIDGPGGSGKSTVARALAERLGWERLDTGAMYRAVALLALRRGTDPGDGEGLASLASEMELSLGEQVLLGDEDVTEAIRSHEVNAVVSTVAAHPKVRVELVARQRAWGERHRSGVVEGRDIGTVVFPGARLKVYLDAHPEVRAARRAGEQAAPPTEAAAALATRDRIDSTRSASPLQVARDALVVDSSELTVDQVVGRILQALGEQPGSPAGAAGPAGAKTGQAPDEKAPPAPRAPARTLPPLPPVRPISRGALAFYACCRAIAVGASHLVLPGPVLGQQVPERGPFVLAPTHRSYVDWLVAARVTRRRLRYLVKQEVWRSRFFGRLVELLGGFPVNRTGADRQAFNRALEVLVAGEPLVVFPEGTRKRGPEVGTLQDGAAYLALRARVPIYPVALGGTERAMPRGSRLPRPARVRVLVGEPLWPADVLGSEPAPGTRIPRAATRELSERLRRRLQELLEQAGH